jgi:hypothetical protein
MRDILPIAALKDKEFLIICLSLSYLTLLSSGFPRCDASKHPLANPAKGCVFLRDIWLMHAQGVTVNSMRANFRGASIGINT